jgi:hypothetical protein
MRLVDQPWPFLSRTMKQAAFSHVGDVAPGLVAREQPGSRPSARLLLEIDVGERLTAVVPALCRAEG